MSNLDVLRAEASNLVKVSKSEVPLLMNQLLHEKFAISPSLRWARGHGTRVIRQDAFQGLHPAYALGAPDHCIRSVGQYGVQLHQQEHGRVQQAIH